MADKVDHVNHECSETLNSCEQTSHEILDAVRSMSEMQSEADQRVATEVKAHTQTKGKIQQLQTRHAAVQERLDKEKSQHSEARRKFADMDKAQQDLKASVEEQLKELEKAKLSNEALKSELEAQRKAFKVDVDWASRHKELLKHHSTVKSDLNKKREEMEAMKAQLAEFGDNADTITAQLGDLTKFKQALEEERVKKMRGKSKAMATLERKLAQGDQGFAQLGFIAWNEFLKNERIQKIRKEKGMKQAARSIASNGDALLNTTFQAWAKDVQASVREAMKAANLRLNSAAGKKGEGAEKGRQNALKALEKGFAAKDAGLLKYVMEGWKKDVFAKKRAGQNKNAALRGIADSDTALTAHVFSSWKGSFEAAKGNKEKKDTAMARAMRMINGSQQALLKTLCEMWSRLARKEKQKLTKMAMVERNLLSEGRGIQDLIVTKWRAWKIDERKQKAGKDKNMQVALRGIADSQNQVVGLVVRQWHEFTDKQRAKSRTKDQSMQRAAKMINSSTQALQASIYRGWGDLARKSASKNTKLRVLQRIMGRDNYQMTIATFYAWAIEVLGEVMKARLADTNKEYDEISVQVASETKRAKEAKALETLKDELLTEHRQELEESRKRAKNIRDELERVGVFLTSQPRRRPSSGNRPTSGNRHGQSGSKKMSARGAEETMLPRIDNGSARPTSARSKSQKQAWDA